MVFHSETMASLLNIVLYGLLIVCLFFRLFLLLLFICNDNIDCLIASSFFLVELLHQQFFFWGCVEVERVC